MSERLSARQVLDRYALEDELPTFFGMNLTDVNQVSPSGDHPLDVAATRGILEEVEALLAGGAEINARGDMGRTALHDAVAHGHYEVAKTLLEAGASPLIKDEFNATPIEIAQMYKREAFVRLLNDYLPQEARGRNS